MRLDAEEYIAALTAAAAEEDSSLRIGAASGAFLRWARRKRLPPELVELYTRCSILEADELGSSSLPGILCDERGLMDSAEEWPRQLAAGLLVIGSTVDTSGDLIQLDLRGQPGTVWLAHMPHVCDPSRDPRHELVRGSPSLGRFVTAPERIDYWRHLSDRPPDPFVPPRLSIADGVVTRHHDGHEETVALAELTRVVVRVIGFEFPPPKAKLFYVLRAGDVEMEWSPEDGMESTLLLERFFETLPRFGEELRQQALGACEAGRDFEATCWSRDGGP